MSKKIIISSFAVILASIFFVVNDAIINYLTPLDIKFYHFMLIVENRSSGFKAKS